MYSNTLVWWQKEDVTKQQDTNDAYTNKRIRKWKWCVGGGGWRRGR